MLRNKNPIPCTLADPQSDSDSLNSFLTLASSSFIFSAEDMLSGWKYCICISNIVTNQPEDQHATSAENYNNSFTLLQGLEFINKQFTNCKSQTFHKTISIPKKPRDFIGERELRHERFMSYSQVLPIYISRKARKYKGTENFKPVAKFLFHLFLTNTMP